VTGHKNNQSALLNDASVAAAEGLTVQEKVSEEAARNERIAKQVSRTCFMGLGENPPKLVCENSHPLLMQNSQLNQFYEKNLDYLTDEHIPPTIFDLIEKYRKRSLSAKPDIHLLIDDFFGEANAILKDSQLREIARIRNENAVEVTKLKKEIKKREEFNYGKIAKENLKGKSNFGSMGADNEVEMERRKLQQENE
jgi:hypothetical protein